MEYARLLRPELLAHVEPVAEVVAHVVTAEGKHGHRIAAQGPDLSFGRGGLLRGQCCAGECAVVPIARFEDERNVIHTPSAKNDRIDRHTIRIFPLGIDGRTIPRGRGEA